MQKVKPVISEYLKETAYLKFEWGTNDCALWSAGLVEKMTDVDVSSDLRGTYASWFECRNVMMRLGGLENIVRDRLSFLSKGEKKNGVGLVGFRGGKILGILCDGKFHMKPVKGRSGIIMISEFNLIEGWSCRKH